MVEVVVLRVLRALLVMRVVALPARLRRAARPGRARAGAAARMALLREGAVRVPLTFMLCPVQGAVVTLRAVVNLRAPSFMDGPPEGPVRRDLRAVDHEDRAMCIHRELLGFEVVLQEIQSPRAEALQDGPRQRQRLVSRARVEGSRHDVGGRADARGPLANGLAAVRDDEHDVRPVPPRAQQLGDARSAAERLEVHHLQVQHAAPLVVSRVARPSILSHLPALHYH